MPINAIKWNDTIYSLEGIRWFEYNDNFHDLTLMYADGSMETIRHRNARKVYRDLLLRYNILDVNSEDYDN
jgi:hypothetical protein